jgi:hypothetical protein
MIEQPVAWGLLFLLGIGTGAIAGVLGIGGGLLMVPALTFLGISLVKATATSLVGVFLSALSGSVQNWRKGVLNVRDALTLALFGIPTAQLGAWLGDRLPEAWLAFGFALLMVVTIYFMNLKQQFQEKQLQEKQLQEKQLQEKQLQENSQQERPVEDISEDISSAHSLLPVAQIGLLAGVLAGLFGIGGGTVMVPLQMLMLGESIKTAVRTSLGAIVLIGASGLAQHTWNNNVLWLPGLCLGLGGILGAQFGARLLPRLSDRLVNRLFRLLLGFLAGYMTWKGLTGKG